ncbi:glycosyltransferase [Amycolatopsis sp. 195334CR]|uniref:glycosyltransferase n=1 Tax=Amycolatopsis sp. 195334CR TaxID=2814588 RepID=UPI001A903281|nr:glycosyltransferase [Amycolatopsis sp. 195334CR]MBN6039543.1 glycosyltransferase family 1 protein [Amycolatopsis sp. 195334CR]
MRILLSTIGSRGDVQPMLALAVALRELGREARLCAPPDFRASAENLGIPFTPVGPELRSTAKAAVPVTEVSPEVRRKMIEGTVTAQFEAITEAAEGCDTIVAGGALQVAARSVAERLGLAYSYSSYCPITLPSPYHAPPPTPMERPDGASNRELWDLDAAYFNDLFGAKLNEHRVAVGLPPIDDVRGHMFTGKPLLAADPVLGPWPEPAELEVLQTGAWILPDERPLPPAVEEFLDAGEAPVYFGFGSMRAPDGLAASMIDAARALGRRAILLHGWADLVLPDDAPDCLAIGEVNQQALFGRVAAVVHHGGAGTTTAAARAGAPQVVVPQTYDQRYWAQRVAELGIGAAHAPGAPDADSLTRALAAALRPEVPPRAKSVANEMRGDGAAVAAKLL